MVESTPFEAAGTVRAKGGTDVEAADWAVGFAQTMRGQSSFTASYMGSKHTGTKGFTLGTPRRDALTGSQEPWYDSNNSNATGRDWFSKADSTVSVSLWDQPEIPVPKTTPDELGKLVRTEGKTSFTTYLIARKASPPNTIKYLNWAAWEVDYGATFQVGADGKPALKRTAGATRGKGTGSGKGGQAPIFRGQLANTAVKAAYKWR
jgi:hypothetical protein